MATKGDRGREDGGGRKNGTPKIIALWVSRTLRRCRNRINFSESSAASKSMAMDDAQWDIVSPPKKSTWLPPGATVEAR